LILIYTFVQVYFWSWYTTKIFSRRYSQKKFADLRK